MKNRLFKDMPFIAGMYFGFGLKLGFKGKTSEMACHLPEMLSIIKPVCDEERQVTFCKHYEV